MVNKLSGPEICIQRRIQGVACRAHAPSPLKPPEQGCAHWKRLHHSKIGEKRCEMPLKHLKALEMTINRRLNGWGPLISKTDQTRFAQVVVHCFNKYMARKGFDPHTWYFYKVLICFCQAEELISYFVSWKRCVRYTVHFFPQNNHNLSEFVSIDTKYG